MVQQRGKSIFHRSRSLHQQLQLGFPLATTCPRFLGITGSRGSGNQSRVQSLCKGGPPRNWLLVGTLLRWTHRVLSCFFSVTVDCGALSWAQCR